MQHDDVSSIILKYSNITVLNILGCLEHHKQIILLLQSKVRLYFTVFLLCAKKIVFQHENTEILP